MCNNRLIVTTFQPFSPTLRRRNDVKLLCRPRRGKVLFLRGLLYDSAPCTLLHNIAQYRTPSHNVAQCIVFFSPHWWSLAAGDASNKALGLLSAFCIICLVQIDVCTRTLDHLRGLSLFQVVFGARRFGACLFCFLFHSSFTCAPHSMKSCAQGMTPTDNGYLAIVVEEINDNLAVLCIAFTLTTAVCFIAS